MCNIQLLKSRRFSLLKTLLIMIGIPTIPITIILFMFCGGERE